MYMDTDSMMFQSSAGKTRNSCGQWISTFSHEILTREDLYLMYGSWADEAAASAFLRPVDDPTSPNAAYAA